MAIALNIILACGGGGGGGGSSSSSGSTITLSLIPANSQTVVLNSVTITASGGSPPYTYSIKSGFGSIDANTGIFTASGIADVETIKAQDSAGNSGTTNITVNAQLSATPAVTNLSFGATQAISPFGGIAPYTYSVTSGGGTVDLFGNYTAPLSATTGIVTISDSALPTPNTATATLNVSNSLAINPSSLNITIGSGTTFTASGGSPPYTYSVISGAGTLDDGTGSFACITGCTGSYLAATSPSTDIIQVTDSLSATNQATVNVYTPLTLSPTILSIPVNGTQTFTGTGGFGTLTYSVAAGLGTIDSALGTYTASASAGTDDVVVTDSIGNTANAVITIVSTLTISPNPVFLSTNSTKTFTTTLGTSPYTYSISSGGGSIVATTGVFTAPSSAQSVTVKVTDAGFNTSTAAVTVVAPTKILASDYNTCTLFNNGLMRCWGYGSYGQLGSGSTAKIGSAAGQMGNANSFINLGTGKTVLDFAMGEYHVCALLNDFSVKCWGYNNKGQLGLGNTTNMGGSATTIGDSLPAVNLGTGKTAQAIFAGGYSSCAILNDNTLKCWGNNTFGNLGQGNITNYGSAAGQMGDSLPVVNLGTGVTATKVYLSNVLSTSGATAYESSTCAILSNSNLVCWGGNKYGQLGQGNTTTYGSTSGQTPSGLTPINLGTNLTAKSLTMGLSAFCAVIHDSTAVSENMVKCWGRNNYGQLGANLVTTATIGSAGGQMGNSLAFVSLPTPTVSQLTGIGNNFCALMTNGSVECWGYNNYGQLGQGNIVSYGSSTSTMATIPGAVSLNSSLIPTQITTGLYHSCVLSPSNDLMQCWGYNNDGQLGLGNTTTKGSSAGQMGNSLPLVSY